VDLSLKPQPSDNPIEGSSTERYSQGA